MTMSLFGVVRHVVIAERKKKAGFSLLWLVKMVLDREINVEMPETGFSRGVVLMLQGLLDVVSFYITFSKNVPCVTEMTNKV